MSASQDKEGKIHATIVNLNPNNEVFTDVILNGFNAKRIKGEVLTSHLYSDYNSFEKPDKVVISQFNNFKKGIDNTITVKMPPLSIVTLEIF